VSPKRQHFRSRHFTTSAGMFYAAVLALRPQEKNSSREEFRHVSHPHTAVGWLPWGLTLLGPQASPQHGTRTAMPVPCHATVHLAAPPLRRRSVRLAARRGHFDVRHNYFRHDSAIDFLSPPVLRVLGFFLGQLRLLARLLRELVLRLLDLLPRASGRTRIRIHLFPITPITTP